MYFGIGGHPGFNIPMEEGLSFEDYELEFSRACEPQRILFSQECFVEGKESYELFEGRRIPLRHNLFDEDAIVLEKTSGEVLLHSTKGKKGSEGILCGYALCRFLAYALHGCSLCLH